MSDKDKIIAAVDVSWNHNNTLLVKFTPDESTWEFPKNNKLKLFNMIHWLISKVESNGECMDSTGKNAIVADEISALLTKWAESGDLVIRK